MMILLSFQTAIASEDTLHFCGGPSGGTFMFYSNAIANIMRKNYTNIIAVPTQGSIDNIRMVDNGDADFGIAYAEDVYDAENGLLEGDNTKYKNIAAVGYLFQSPIQIVTQVDSPINSVYDLKGKTVAIGEIGSGSAASARKILSAIGIWNQVKKYYIGYRSAIPLFRNKTIDALWTYSGSPNPTIAELSRLTGIKMVDIKNLNIPPNDRQVLNVYKKFSIPAGTYVGMGKQVSTLAGNTIWIVNKNVNDDIVTRLMTAIYSTNGIKILASQHKSVANFKISNGINGIITPLHPAAKAFWASRGVIK